MYGGTQSNFNPGLNSTVIYTGTSSQMNNYNFEFAGLFDKICWVFKKCTKELK